MTGSKTRCIGSATASAGLTTGPRLPSTSPRAAILRTADELFSQLGYDATTYQLIADRLGLTRTAVNYHFPSKRMLHEEVVSSKAAQLMQAATNKAVTAPTLVGQLCAFVSALTQEHNEDGCAAAFLVASMIDSRRHPVRGGSASDPLEATREFLRCAVSRAVERGEVVGTIDRPAVVEMLLALVWGIGFYAGFVDRGEQIPAVNEQFRRLLPGRRPEPPASAMAHGAAGLDR